MAINHAPSLLEVVTRFLSTLKESEREEGQQQLNHFVRWFGRDKRIDQLTPSEIEDYAQWWGPDSTRKLKSVKSFLVFLKRKGFTVTSLATHLKVTKDKKSSRYSPTKYATEPAQVTPEGYRLLQARLELLKEERLKVIEDIQRAMADKDFRENAPLEAAKERQGIIEAQIRQLEEDLSRAVITDSQRVVVEQRVKIGKKVTLKDIATGREIIYTLVDPRETDPTSGKISCVSPVGKALMDKHAGDEVYITVPRGTLHYIIQTVEG